MKNINDIPEKNPFKVPDGYFEEVNRKIISGTVASAGDEKKPGRFRIFRPYLLAAASVTGFILLSYSLFRVLSNDKRMTAERVNATEELSVPYLDEIDISSLEENAAPVFASEDVPGVSKSDIIDYLILDNIDIDDIYEQL